MSKFLEYSSANRNFLEMKEVWGCVSDFAINAWNELSVDEQARLSSHFHEPGGFLSFEIDEEIVGIAKLEQMDHDEIVGKIKLMDTSRLSEPNPGDSEHRLIGTAEFLFQRDIKTIVADPNVHPNIALDEAYIEKLCRIAELTRIPAAAS